MANVYDVADFFVQLANQSEDDQITNLKLNKLLYFAQGAYLARTGKPLFNEQIEAWQYGPVVPSIYRKYKVCGRNPIPTVEQEVPRCRFQDDEFEVLLDVMRELGQYTGNRLVSITHKPGSPWSKAFDSKSTVIDQSEIQSYFTEHPVPRFQDQTNALTVSALPADWYDPKEDAEWEAYL